MNKYMIRTCNKEDINQVIDLCEEHAIYEQAIYNKVGKASQLSSYLFCENPSIHCLVVESGTELVGYATYSYEFSTWDANLYAHMDCLYLKPTWRGRGIGEELIKEIAKAAIQKGITQIQWQTPDFNTRAIKFYNRIGATSKSKERFTMNETAIKNILNHA
jgi:ribosomal protein S18 acetylase RimI-like enzyme